MIFRQIDEILDGRKTQTRRVVKDGEYERLGASINDLPAGVEAFFQFGTGPMVQGPKHLIDKIPIHSVVMPSGCLKWAVGRTYAIQPKRGAPGIKTHRIQITGIRQERLQDISETDVEAEGVGLQSWAAQGNEQWPRTAGYAELWTSINTRKGVRWEDNPLVWVLEFECVEVPS
jgi:hypothetical protein